MKIPTPDVTKFAHKRYKIAILEKDFENVCKLLLQNKTYSYIADIYNVTENVVNQFGRKWKVNQHKPHHKQIEYGSKKVKLQKNLQKIKDMILKGQVYKDISKTFQVSQNTLIKFCKENNIRKTDLYSKNNKKIPKVSKIPIPQKSVRMCSCCGVRPVPVKPFNGITLTRLCIHCYVNAYKSYNYEEHNICLSGGPR